VVFNQLMTKPFDGEFKLAAVENDPALH
jgi:hypothetical protein